MPPPSIVCGTPIVPTRPPHVRVPTSGPSFRCLNMYGSASPPEPADSFTIITFGPKIPAIGDVTVLPSRIEIAHELSIELVHDVVGHLTALIVALVDDRALFLLLREEVAREVRVTGGGCVRQPHVRE